MSVAVEECLRVHSSRLELRSTVARFKILEKEIPYGAGHVCGPIKGIIMEKNSNPIFGQWNIKLNKFSAVVFSLLHWGDGVLWLYTLKLNLNINILKYYRWTAVTSDSKVGKEFVSLKRAIKHNEWMSKWFKPACLCVVRRLLKYR